MQISKWGKTLPSGIPEMEAFSETYSNVKYSRPMYQERHKKYYKAQQAASERIDVCNA
jgi:hypothetical protein